MKTWKSRLLVAALALAATPLLAAPQATSGQQTNPPNSLATSQVQDQDQLRKRDRPGRWRHRRRHRRHNRRQNRHHAAIMLRHNTVA